MNHKRQEGRIQKVGKGFSFQKNYISQRLIGNLLFSCHYLLETASSRVFMGLRICNLLFDIKSWIHYPFKHLILRRHIKIGKDKFPKSHPQDKKIKKKK